MVSDSVRRYWRGLVIAAAVSFRQIGETPGTRMRELPPYVLVRESHEPDGFDPLERVGRTVLTMPLDEVPAHSMN